MVIRMKLIKFGQIPTGTRFQDSGISYLKISMFFLKDDTLRHFGKAIIEGHASNEQQVTVEFASDDLVYVDDNVYQSIKEEYNLPYKVDPQQQTCKVCGRPDKFNFHVPDAVWEWIVPEGIGIM